MKKIVTALIAMLLVFQAGQFVVFADADTPRVIDKIYILAMDAGEQEVDCPLVDKIVVSEDGVTVSKCITIDDEQWSEPGSDSSYCYQLTLKTNGQVVFSNHLVVVYQGVNGEYALNYEIIDDDHHTMIVNGKFDNVIQRNEIIDKIDLEQILLLLEKFGVPVYAHIDPNASLSNGEFLAKAINITNGGLEKDDRNGTYRYNLLLRTNEGFSFANDFKFLYRGNNIDYSLDYEYSLGEDNHTIRLSLLINDAISVIYPWLPDGPNGFIPAGGKLAIYKDGKIDTSQNGILKDEKTGNWYYVENGVVNRKTGVAGRSSDGALFYVKKGIYDNTFTGLAQGIGTDTQYYIKKGKLNKVTGMYKVDNVWRYFVDGVFTEATGIAQRPDNKQWYYIENGVFTKKTGAAKRISDGKWFYVQNGKFTKSTGLAKRMDNNNWYYFKSGSYYNKFTGEATKIGGDGTLYNVKDGKMVP